LHTFVVLLFELCPGVVMVYTKGLAPELGLGSEDLPLAFAGGASDNDMSWPVAVRASLGASLALALAACAEALDRQHSLVCYCDPHVLAEELQHFGFQLCRTLLLLLWRQLPDAQVVLARDTLLDLLADLLKVNHWSRLRLVSYH
jgi:hypothetical protein